MTFFQHGVIGRNFAVTAFQTGRKSSVDQDRKISAKIQNP